MPDSNCLSVHREFDWGRGDIRRSQPDAHGCVRCGNDEKLFADFFPEKKTFPESELVVFVVAVSKGRRFEREKEEEEEEEEEKDADVDRNKTRKPKCCRKASFVLTVLLVVGNLVG